MIVDSTTILYCASERALSSADGLLFYLPYPLASSLRLADFDCCYLRSFHYILPVHSNLVRTKLVIVYGIVDNQWLLFDSFDQSFETDKVLWQ